MEVTEEDGGDEDDPVVLAASTPVQENEVASARAQAAIWLGISRFWSGGAARHARISDNRYDLGLGDDSDARQTRRYR